jgi:micrococcal nuclease
MPDLSKISNAEIRVALSRALPACDTGSPTSFEYAIDQLVPAVRELLDRPRPGYTYRARVVECTDWDTVVLNIDLGMRQWCHDEPIRLLGVNAPDRKPLKAKATAWMEDAAPEGTELVVRTHLDEEDKYGRLLGDLWLGDLHLNTALIDAGLGQPYAGGTRPADY